MGRAGAGKTTVADYLCDKYGFVKFSRSSPLKRMLVEAGMCTWAEVFGKEKSNGVGWLLQRVEADIFRRQADRDYWAKRGDEMLNELMQKGEVIVIDDVRFDDEAMNVKSRGGILVRIVKRMSTPYDSPNLSIAEHESEAEADRIAVDYVVEAEVGNLRALFNGVERVLDKIAACIAWGACKSIFEDTDR